MTTKTTHTPGPWTTQGGAVYDSQKREVCDPHAYAGSSRIPGHEREANAALIAAAPELLRELKSAIFYIETYGGAVTDSFSAGGNMDAVKSVINKAEGRGQ